MYESNINYKYFSEICENWEFVKPCEHYCCHYFGNHRSFSFQKCRILLLRSLKQLKFIYSEKTTKFCEISTLLLSYVVVVPVKSKVEISQNFVAFSEYMNFTELLICVTKKTLIELKAVHCSAQLLCKINRWHMRHLFKSWVHAHSLEYSKGHLRIYF